MNLLLCLPWRLLLHLQLLPRLSLRMLLCLCCACWCACCCACY